MALDKEMIENLRVMARKEQLLGEIIVWLKAKGLYNEAARDIGMPLEEDGKSG